MGDGDFGVARGVDEGDEERPENVDDGGNQEDWRTGITEVEKGVIRLPLRTFAKRQGLRDGGARPLVYVYDMDAIFDQNMAQVRRMLLGCLRAFVWVPRLDRWLLPGLIHHIYTSLER